MPSKPYEDGMDGSHLIHRIAAKAPPSDVPKPQTSRGGGRNRQLGDSGNATRSRPWLRFGRSSWSLGCGLSNLNASWLVRGGLMGLLGQLPCCNP
jgi:hypothetical protein